MPKRNLLNSGKPKALDFGIRICYGNPERIQWEHWKRATTYNASRTQAVGYTLCVNTVGYMTRNVSSEKKTCVDCSESYDPKSNRQLRCTVCQLKEKKRLLRDYHKRTYLKKGYNQYREKNNNWKGGIGIFRQLVKRKKCESCGSTKNPCVHHKDGNRYNNAKKNLARLCKRCHQVQHQCWKSFTVHRYV